MKLLAPLALAVLLVPAACAPGDGMRFQVMNMERPSDDGSMPPPPDYQPCFTGLARGYDTNGDGKVDKIAVTVEGKPRCYGEDANHDGKIDTWDLVDAQGNLERRAHDSNGDGRADQAWTFDPSRHGCATVALDLNADGKPDPGSPVDLCKALGAPPAAPAAPPAPPAPLAR